MPGRRRRVRRWTVMSSARPAGVRLLAPVALSCALTIACGKKGPPLPPFSHVPAAIGTISARRVGDDVFLTFKVPTQNIDNSTPVDVASIDVLALTTTGDVARPSFIQHATRIATLPVAPPPPPPPKNGTTPPPAPEPPPGSVSPGEDVTIRDVLTMENRVPVTIPPAQGRGAAPVPSPAAAAGSAGQPAPLPAPRRVYIAVPSNIRQRSNPNGAQVSVTVADAPPPPRLLPLAYDERTLMLTWTAGEAGETYNVYREPSSSSAPPAPATVGARGAPPAPVNGGALEVTTYRLPVEFGREACFRIRALRRGPSGELLEGPASEPMQCITPVDTFPPAPPADVVAVGGEGRITISWLPNAEPDLAGYLVLRGAPGDATLAPITPAPIPSSTTRYVDLNVMPGVRYVYVVLAVDNAANRSGPSEREEANAR